MITLLLCLIALSFVGFGFLMRENGDFNGAVASMLIAILFAVGACATQADDFGLTYVCSTEYTDTYRLITNEDTWWTFVPQMGEQQSVNQSGIYTFKSGGVFVWVGLNPIGLAEVGDVTCEDNMVYVAPLIECLGFYAPVEEFSVDGRVYSAGTDGWVSFQVPRDSYWTWEVEVAGWTGHYQQTESEPCHYVD
jgi:hypothetical protein